MHLYKCLLIQNNNYIGASLELWADSKASAIKRLKGILPEGIGWKIERLVDSVRYQKFAQHG